MADIFVCVCGKCGFFWQDHCSTCMYAWSSYRIHRRLIIILTTDWLKKVWKFCVIKQSCIVELQTSFHSTFSWFSLNRSCNIIVISLLSQYTEHYYITWWHAPLCVCIETSFVQSIYIPKP